MAGDTANSAVQLLLSILSDELGVPLPSVICALIGDRTEGCGSVATSAALLGGQLERGLWAENANGVVEAAVLALASWGVTAVSLIIAVLVYCSCTICCAAQGGIEYPGAQRGGAGVLRRSTRPDMGAPAVRPASPSALAMVDTFSATQADMKAISSSEQRAAEAESDARPSCVVCVEHIAAGQRVSRLACGHLFHARCLLTWLQRADSCPNCRMRLEDGYESRQHG